MEDSKETEIPNSLPSTWNLWLDVVGDTRTQVWVLEKDDKEVMRSNQLTKCTRYFGEQCFDGDKVTGGLFSLAIENDPLPYEAWPKEEPLPFPDEDTIRSWGAT